MRRNLQLILLVTLVAAILLIPLPTTVVSKWSLHLVDQDGKPIALTKVQQSCYHYTYFINWDICGEAPDARQTTDDGGYVEFSEKSISLGLLSRGIRAISSYFLTFFHGSTGVQATLFVSSVEELEPTVINLDSGPPSDGIIRLKRKE